MQTIHAQKVQDARRVQFPADAVVQDYADIDAVVVIYQARNEICAAGFTGRKVKPVFRLRFPTTDRREQYVTTWLTEQRARQERNTRTAATPNPFEQGDIVWSSWGFEQTNVDFYKVIAATASTVVLRKLAAIKTPQDAEHFPDRGTCVPVPDQFEAGSKEFRARVSKYLYGDEVECTVNVRYGVGKKWDGTPRRYTEYA